METAATIIEKLRLVGNEKNLAGMARFGINTQTALGTGIVPVRQIAKTLKRNHPLALDLWGSGIHEARILASIIADPKQMTPDLMDEWIKVFNSWDLCDQVCGNLFCYLPWAYEKVSEWCAREPEFERRAGFSLIAYLAVHDKKAANERFYPFFDLIEKYAFDERNFVKKAVNWSLRQLGKRNSNDLQTRAVACAKRVQQQPHKAARWIATDALREFEAKKIGLAI